MAVLIPAYGACKPRMTHGERRLAERLEQKLENDYLLWYDVPVGPLQKHPDFIVLHPSRGLLVLEVKDFRLGTIVQADKQNWQIIDSSSGETKRVLSPFEQARSNAHAVLDALRADRTLVHPEGRRKGELVFAWSYGVVLTNITRKQFGDAGLEEAIPGNRVICSDEMTEAVDSESFQSQLWEMFPYERYQTLTLPQIDRVRWLLFPQVRIPEQASLFDEAEGQTEVPDILRVMDLQQEQLARSLGSGHRVIHGVAGSGKTMILGFRAEQLARAHATGKPILVLCYNEPLAVKLASMMAAKGLAERVHCVHWDKWTSAQLSAYGLNIPFNGSGAVFEERVQRLIANVDAGHIPGGQYMAVLIDEGHDFAPEWLKLVTQMVDPDTNSLLLLYDDAQSIYGRSKKRGFSLKSVGIEASGRTTILKINYRNTKQILHLANKVAGGMLKAEVSSDDDGIPLLKPMSCGRDGPEPVVIDLPTLTERVTQVAERLADEYNQGHAWRDMAVLCRHYDEMYACEAALRRKGLPHRVRKGTGDFKPEQDVVQIMTMHASKGLEWPIVAVVADEEKKKGKSSKTETDPEIESRLVYVAATRATHKLLVSLPPASADVAQAT